VRVEKGAGEALASSPRAPAQRHRSGGLLIRLAILQRTFNNALDLAVVPHGSGSIKSPLRSGHDYCRPVYD
jgi:hypothetical protein